MNLETLIPGMDRDKNVGNTERMLSIFSGAGMLLSGLYGIRRTPFTSAASAAAGFMLLSRGLSGHCFINDMIGRNTACSKITPLEINEVIRVDKPRNEVYAYWRRLENFPFFMKHLASVTQIDAKRSHWEASVPGGMGTLEWDAEISEETENEKLAWQSVPGAVVDNNGEVRFSDATGGGTILEVLIAYYPPAGEIGHAVSQLFNDRFESLIRQDLQGFRKVMEGSGMA